jgi:hypothetical protein
VLFIRHGLHTSDKGDVKGRESTEIEAILFSGSDEKRVIAEE